MSVCVCVCAHSCVFGCCAPNCFHVLHFQLAFVSRLSSEGVGHRFLSLDVVIHGAIEL